MSGIQIAELLVKIGVDGSTAQKAASELHTELDKTSDASERAEGRFAGFRKAAGGAAKAMAALGAAAIAAGAAIFKLVDSVTKGGDEIIKTAQTLGAGTDQLQRLQFAADRSGASTADLEKGIRTLNKGLDDVARGSGKAVSDTLAKLGLTIDDIRGRDVEQQFGILADALAGVSDEAERSAAAAALFGARSGPELKVLLDEGSAGIRLLGDEAERLGGVISQDTLEASAEFQDQLTNLQLVFKGLIAEGVAAAIPVVSELVETFRNWIQTNRQLIQQKVRDFLSRLLRVMKDLLPALLRVVDALVSLADTIGQLAGSTALATTAVVALGAAFGGLPGAIVAAGTVIGTFSAQLLPQVRAWKEEAEELRLQASIARRDAERFRREREELVARREGLEADVAAQQRALTQGFAEGDQDVAEQLGLRERTIVASLSEQAGARARRDARAAGQTVEQAFVAGQRAQEAERRRLEARSAQARGIVRAAQERGASIEQLQRVQLQAFQPERTRPATPERRVGRPRRRVATPARPEAPTSPVTLQDFVRAAAEGELGPVASQTPAAAEIAPTVAVTITNNSFDVDITIDGAQSPEATAREVKRELDRGTSRELRRAGQAIAGNLVR